MELCRTRFMHTILMNQIENGARIATYTELFMQNDSGHLLHQLLRVNLDLLSQSLHSQAITTI